MPTASPYGVVVWYQQNFQEIAEPVNKKICTHIIIM